MLIKKDTNVVQSFLKELPKNFVIQHIQNLTASAKLASVEEYSCFKNIKPLKASYFEIFNRLKEKQNQLGEEVTEDVKNIIATFIYTLTPQYSDGDLFQKVTEIEKITFAGDDTATQVKSELKIEIGKVNLVHIWGVKFDWDNSFESNQQMLEKNKQWAGKVRIVGLSVDDDTELFVEKVKSKKWKQMEHYRLLDGFQNDLFQSINYSIPYVILINKLGKIDYLGNPENVNIEARINELIVAQDNENQVQEEQQIDNPQVQCQLMKEEYKQSKQILQNLQTALTEAQFEGKVQVVLFKINNWKQDGSKQIHERSKLALSYDIYIEEEAKINDFLEHHWNKVPENLKIVEQSRIKDPLTKFKQFKAEYQEYFLGLGVEISYQIAKTTISFNSKIGTCEVQNSKLQQLTALNLNWELYNKAQEKLNELQKKYITDDFCGYSYENEIYQITVYELLFSIMSKGKQFQPISNYKKWGEEEFTSIEHVPGQILILNYWRNTDETCVDHILKNTQFLQENSNKWGNSVRFVSLSLELAEGNKEFMDNNQESLKYIDFYFPKEVKQQDTKLYNVIYTPRYIVVDKLGTIRMIQDMNTDARYEDYEDLLKKLLGAQVKGLQSQEIVEKVIGIIEQASEQFVQVDKAKILQFDVEFEQFEVQQQIKYKKPRLNIFCRDTQLKVIDQVVANIFSFIPENNWLITKKVSKTYSVQYPGTNCVVCQKDITNETQQYYSPFKKEHVCVECAEFDDKTKKGLERYKYQDTLIFINGPLTDLSVLDEIDDERIGKNLKLNEWKEGAYSRRIFCSGCCGYKENEQEPKYIASSIRSGNCIDYTSICQGCFVILKNKKSDQAQEIIKQNQTMGMTEDSLLVRILFGHGSYRKF